MRVKVDQELCIACGACLSLAPDIFSWNDQGKAEAGSAEVTAEHEDAVHKAIESCPTEAIKEE